MAPDDTIIVNYSRHTVHVLNVPREYSSSGDRSELKVSPCWKFGNLGTKFGNEFGNSQKIQKKVTPRSADLLWGLLLPGKDQSEIITDQEAFSKGYTKSNRKKESQSKALRVVCEVGLLIASLQRFRF
jgi:hypothetical protein